MNQSILQKIGLTADQAQTYQLLLEAGSLTPRGLMKQSKDKRTNAYMSLAKLQELGLAQRDGSTKQLTYRPVSPAKLERLLETKQQELEASKHALQNAMPDLLTIYYASADRPGVRFYQGEDSLEKVYHDHLETGQDVYFVRTPADEDFFGDKLYEYMQQRADKGLTAYGIAPFSRERAEYSKAYDKQLKRSMSYCAPEQYTSPVEISIYGNKTAFISFGEEIVASIIDSPQIAQAMKELFDMARRGAAARFEKNKKPSEQ
jgi:sugar-specific transcriptional regulator TrmB